MASSTLDLPEDWPPTTTIWGRSRVVFWPRAPSTSWSLDAMGISSSILWNFVCIVLFVCIKFEKGLVLWVGVWCGVVTYVLL